MITEDFVSFETAKLLKEKGFDINCYTHYSSDGQIVYYNYLTPSDGINMPTLQMAMKWLMRMHNIFITITMYLKEGITLFHYELLEPYDNHIDVLYSEDSLKTYEQACETAIKYCIENLI